MEGIILIHLDKNACFRRNEQILYKEIGGEGVLIDPYRRTLVKLNPTAREIWLLLDGRRTCAGILEELKAVFDVDGRDLEKDVEGLLKSFIRREMIQ
ncbi:MAG: PqqD family protein [Candidatus Omnitrophota bacterium]